MQLIPMNI